MGKTVTISAEDFEAMVKRIEDQDARIDELETANAFLNEQIKEYNEEFTEHE